MDYFELLAVPKRFSLDLHELETQYFALQQQFHPDRYVNKPNQERIIALQKATDINQGYETLKSPLKRAEYLLSLQGKEVNGENDQVEQDILIEAMEQRECLMEANSNEEVISLTKQTDKNIDACITLLDKAFASEDYSQAERCTRQLKYLTKFLEEIRTKQLILDREAS